MIEVHTGVTWQIRWIDLCGGGGAGCRYLYCSNLLSFPVRETDAFHAQQNVNL